MFLFDCIPYNKRYISFGSKVQKKLNVPKENVEIVS